MVHGKDKSLYISYYIGYNMRPVAIDLFAGAGGISEGLRLAGFDVKYANEVNKQATDTYSYNHPETYTDRRDIRDVDARDILNVTGKRIKLVAGGPPCQGFSMLGKRNPRDRRNSLSWQFIRIVKETRPAFFLMENVPGIMTISNGNLFNKMVKEFTSIGYKTSFRLLNASDFGIPQNRERVFVLGSRSKRKDLTKAHFGKRPTVTVTEALSDLDFLRNGESSSEYEKEPMTKYQRMLRKRTRQLHNHTAARHTERIIKRFALIPPGKGIKSLPENLRIKKNIMYRLLPDKPARTVTSLPDDYIHYNKDRILTVREMARLQSFNDRYVFLGNRTTGGRMRKKDCPQYTQVANAVPPLMVQAVGKWLLDG